MLIKTYTTRNQGAAYAEETATATPAEETVNFTVLPQKRKTETATNAVAEVIAEPAAVTAGLAKDNNLFFN